MTSATEDLVATKPLPRETRVPARTAQERWHAARSVLAPIAVAICLAGIALYLYVPSFFEVETDDAYVAAHTVTVIPKLAAYVTALHVNDNTDFTVGQLLVELDSRDFRVALDRAHADLNVARADATAVRAQLAEQQTTIDQREAVVDADRATLAFAQQQAQRYRNLAATGAGTTERWQQAQMEHAQQAADLQRDLAAVAAARAHVAVLQAQQQQVQAEIDRAQAALAQARLNLSYTRIVATEAGSVANKTVQVGDFVQPGQVLFSVVPARLYVTANYKETQLTRVRPGQKVTIRVDAFPSLHLIGHVDSLQHGTGSQFALLPPENATGNFVKVVQRIPVKIVLDQPGRALGSLSPGMSVETTIFTALPPWWLRWL